MNTDRAAKTVRAAGLLVEGVDQDEDGSSILTPEASFHLYSDGTCGVTMWSESYPFANDHDMGVLPSLDEAVRYVRWLLAMEQLQDGKAESHLTEAYARSHGYTSQAEMRGEDWS